MTDDATKPEPTKPPRAPVCGPRPLRSLGHRRPGRHDGRMPPSASELPIDRDEARQDWEGDLL